MQRIRGLNCILISTLLSLALPIRPVQANCNEIWNSLTVVQPLMERIWQKLQQEPEYPWGKARPYGDISGEEIVLTKEFDRLTGAEKKQVLDLLRLSKFPSELYTPEEIAAISAKLQAENPSSTGQLYFGFMTPYKVFGSDGRLISYPYSACDRLTTLTEYARYQLSRSFRELPPRQIRFPLSPQKEKSVRLKFWNAVGYKQPDLQWISWVPERGHFEIDVTNQGRSGYKRRLQKFWRVAPRNYRYVVVDADGTTLETR